MSNKGNTGSLLYRLYEEDSYVGIKEAFTEVCRHYSLDRFFFGSCHFSNDRKLGFELISDSYPGDWLIHYTKSEYHLHDPRLKEYGRIRPPFTWDLGKKNDNLLPIQQKMFHEACDFGVGKGMTILFGMENGYQTVLSVPNKNKIHPEVLNTLKLSANIYHAKKISFESKNLISKLTPREYEVLILRSKGLPYKVIADKLHISKDTVTFHTRNIREKLNATSIDHAMFKFGFSFRDQ